MNKLLLLSTYSLAIGCSLFADCNRTSNRVLTSLIPRSQERNRPQQLVGLCDQTYLLDAGPFYGTAAVTGAYTKTFKAKNIAEAFFGSALFCNGDHPYLKIQGNSYLGDDRDAKALFADYFYLPQNYSSEIYFSPRIQNYSADLDLYFGLNNLFDGLYLRIHSPLVYTQWKLNMCEKIITPGSVSHNYGYFTPDILPADQLLSHFSQYGCGKSPQNITDNGLNLSLDTVVFDGIQYAKLTKETKNKTRLADIRIELGNVLKETEKYSINAQLQLLIPTGTKKRAKYLFEPVIGNGRHWELGGGLQGDYVFYKNDLKESYATLEADFNITHLFTTRQKRTFDLKNKELSRYMLATRFTYALEEFNLPEQTPIAQFANQYAPVANISTLDISISAAIQIDASVFVHYQKKQWDFDLGYNIWYRSQEKIKCENRPACSNEQTSICDAKNTNRWALKGDARMYAFVYDEDYPGELQNINNLSATQSNATIYQGTNKVAVDCTLSAIPANNNIDNGQTINDYGTTRQTSCPDDSNVTLLTIKTSIQPIFIQASDLDIVGSRGLSHKVFANTAYSGKWRDYKTTFGLGASAEFGMHDNDNRTNFAVSQWAVWLKGGLAFD